MKNMNNDHLSKKAKKKSKKKSKKKAKKKAKEQAKVLYEAIEIQSIPVAEPVLNPEPKPQPQRRPSTSPAEKAFSPLQDAFISAWQEAGQAWGLPPAMGAVHGVLMSRDRAWSTDEIMEALDISRGNAHMQLKALVEWGVAHSVRQLGSRRIGYVAERDVWRIATAVAQERRKRELRPVLEMNKLLRAHGASSRSQDDRQLKATLKEIVAFGRLMDKLLGETLKRDERWWERLVRRWVSRS